MWYVFEPMKIVHLVVDVFCLRNFNRHREHATLFSKIQEVLSKVHEYNTCNGYSINVGDYKITTIVHCTEDEDDGNDDKNERNDDRQKTATFKTINTHESNDGCYGSRGYRNFRL